MTKLQLIKKLTDIEVELYNIGTDIMNLSRDEFDAIEMYKRRTVLRKEKDVLDDRLSFLEGDR